MLPNRATIRAAIVRLVAREPAHAVRRAAYDPVIPQASSTIDVALDEEHTRAALDALVAACAAFPRFNATFAWSGITEHPDVVVDLDLGPSAPARGGALFPHLYGSLPVNRALWVRELPIGFGGTHVFPPEVTG